MSHSLRQTVVAPDTGSLRGDLMQMAELVSGHARPLADTLAAILSEVRRNPRLSAIIETGLLHEKRPITQQILRQAAERGEIHPSRVDTPTAGTC